MSIKALKFAKDLVPLVLSGEKTSTWRLWDDKDIQAGDMVELVGRPDLRVFAKGEIISVVKKPMGKLTTEDKKGHETFDSDEQMYKTYTRYYKRPVDSNTLVKIIRFKLTG